MLRAFTPVITLILTFVTKQAKPNRELIFSILLLSIGTFITSVNVSKSDASTIGFIIMFTAEACEAAKLVLSQKLMQGITIQKSIEQNITKDDVEERQQFLNSNTNIISGENNDIDTDEKMETVTVNVKFTVFEGSYYYAPMTFLCQCCLSLPMEYNDFTANWDRNISLIANNWMKFVICGCLGFGVNMASWLVQRLHRIIFESIGYIQEYMFGGC